ncbi:MULTISPECIES: hypothetical protein [Acidiphilium]|jgi:hypothetical protein|uniref:Uncharacterized protein n=1 Tax=Acidiphilium cryptum (strain JF-5) TaxID=349163 RepID=A5FWQ2_ACICJ|nr:MULTISPECIES: hypothetical protein [Acidiphilium]MBU6356527.1 hypothetical protein [Rhodospirillales bacterium]ABQ30034.1 hypothetical protein Acry_0815 [Acidiphilium cryptum JF-5]EGO96655.1 hypothetical protein APM_0489 [Acidiphilium sp. PM]KDM67408.1 hypothetical protein ACIDI_35c00400 [Acidiphilium sp. JA12-A1]MDE2328457.1 hypothetical protein [Rhodospirillales bacterium]
MIIHNLAAAAQPIAYAGGIASSHRPGFGATLQATLASLQATQAGTSAVLNGIGPAQALPGAQSSTTHHHHQAPAIPGLG